MNQLVSHLWRTNREEILRMSLLNCHCRGLHSIMLSATPGKVIRLFYADSDHELYHNKHGNLGKAQTVAFHPHHCEVTLACISGFVANWIVNIGGELAEIPQYSYSSEIKDGKSGFTRCGTAKIESLDFAYLPNGKGVYMPAHAVHTIWVPRWQSASWFVFEGREDPAYSPLAWSYANLENFDSSKLYQPMPEERIQTILKNLFQT